MKKYAGVVAAGVAGAFTFIKTSYSLSQNIQ